MLSSPHTTLVVFLLSSTALLPQADVRGQLLPQETSTCVWLLSVTLVKRGIADNANSNEGNDRFCKWKGRLHLGNGQGGKKSHMAGSWWKMRDPFPIPLVGKWGPVKTLYSHVPLLHAYPLHLVPFLSYQSSPLPSSHTLPWYFTLHPHYPILLVPFFLPTCHVLETYSSSQWKSTSSSPSWGWMLFPYLSCPVAPPDLPAQFPRDRLPAQECPAPAEGLPQRLPQALAVDAWLVGMQRAAWGLCSQSASTQAVSLEGWAAAPEEPQLLRFADIRAKHWFVSLW